MKIYTVVVLKRFKDQSVNRVRTPNEEFEISEDRALLFNEKIPGYFKVKSVVRK